MTNASPYSLNISAKLCAHPLDHNSERDILFFVMIPDLVPEATDINPLYLPENLQIYSRIEQHVADKCRKVCVKLWPLLRHHHISLLEIDIYNGSTPMKVVNAAACDDETYDHLKKGRFRISIDFDAFFFYALDSLEPDEIDSYENRWEHELIHILHLPKSLDATNHYFKGTEPDYFKIFLWTFLKEGLAQMPKWLVENPFQAVPMPDIKKELAPIELYVHAKIQNHTGNKLDVLLEPEIKALFYHIGPFLLIDFLSQSAPPDVSSPVVEIIKKVREGMIPSYDEILEIIDAGLQITHTAWETYTLQIFRENS